MKRGNKTGFSLEGLEHGKERADINIASLEKAIKDEKIAIKEYKLMINDVEKAKRDHEEALKMSRTIEISR